MSEIKPVAYLFDWNLEKDDISVTHPTDLELISIIEPHNIRPLVLQAAYEALRKEKDKIENELDEYKEHHEELTEHYKALQFLESEFRKENADLQLRLDAKTLSHQMMLDRTLELQAENDEQKRKIISLENELVEWNEFKKIRDAQMQALRKQMP